MAAKKIERGTLYLCGAKDKLEVLPVDGKKFSTEEIQQAVGGCFEMMIPAVRHTLVYVNEEGALKGLLTNKHTWEFANRAVYALNGYQSGWCVCGNALVVRKVDSVKDPPSPSGMPTIAVVCMK